MESKNLKLTYKKPIVAVDGQTIFITEQGPVNIAFFQLREESAQGVDADVVAAVRLHTLQELKDFAKLINETVEKHEKREK